MAYASSSLFFPMMAKRRMCLEIDGEKEDRGPSFFALLALIHHLLLQQELTRKVNSEKWATSKIRNFGCGNFPLS